MVTYDEKCMLLMDKREKDTTRRLFNPKKRPGIPGKIHWIKIDRTPTVYGQYKVISCYPQRFGDMNEVDAHHEGFDSLWEYKKYFYSVNGFIEDDEFVWVMEFEILWTNKNGITKEELYRRN